jgi:GT2 family glycosyltransferase
MNTKIGVVIVTFNRLEKLKTALSCFDNQTLLPEYIIVVDNCSTDGTHNFLQDWSSKKGLYQKVVITTETNIGGSGGYYTGLKASLGKNADWVWVSDDDAYPEKNALEEGNKFLSDFGNKVNNISAICGEVINNGKIDFFHRRSFSITSGKINIALAPKEDYSKPYFEINAFSYVGTIISKTKMLSAGLPRKEFFIGCDDTEHSLRLSKIGAIYCVPSIKIHHDLDSSLVKSNYFGISWRTYYEKRNHYFTYCEFFPNRYS